MVNYNYTRKSIESQYTDICDVITKVTTRDPVTRETVTSNVVAYAGQRCRVSYQAIASAGAQDGAATIAQTIKLFIAPECDIPAGSLIVVNRHANYTEYEASGAPAMYPTHQEIMLQLSENWA